MSKHFEMLPEEAFQKDPFGNIKLYKKGGGGGPTETSVQQSNIPEYAQPYVETMLGAAQQQLFQGNTDAEGNFNVTGFNEYKPYSTNMQDYVAGFSPMQQQAFQGAANLQTPGQFGAATGLAGASGYGSLGTAGQAANLGQAATNVGMGGLGYGALGAGYGALGAQQGQQAAGYGAMGAGYGMQAGQAGANFAQQATNPNAVRAYMNPYLESSLSPQIDAMRRQYGITGTEQQSRATGAGAFGGTREALMAAENQRAMNSAIDNTIAQGYNTAFQNAQQQQQFGANIGLQGQNAAMQGAGIGITGQNAAMQGAGMGMQGAGMGLQGIGTALQGYGQGQQGLSTALQGYGQAGQAAGQLGQLGSQQLAAEQGILGLQQQYGAMQQQAEQQKIDQAIQNYAMQQQAPMQSLAQMSGLLRGLPLEATTTQSYQAGPGALQSLAGIGTGIAGVASLAKAGGGTVKSYAGGGIVGYAGGGDVMSQENAEGIAQNMVPQQLEKVQPRTLPDYIRIPLLNQKVQEQQAAQQAMAAQQGMADQESLKQQVLAQAEDLGITGAQSNLPDEAMMAGGGIVSFATGNVVNAPKFPYSSTDMDYSYLDEEAKKLYNKETGKAYTFEEKAAENRAREKAANIKDLTDDELTVLKEKGAKLGAREDRAKGLGLLASSEAIMNAKPGRWAGAGLGAYGKTVGPELEKIDAIQENYDQQSSLLRSKQMEQRRAALAGDTAGFDKLEKDIQAIKIKQGEGANANIAAKKAAELEAAKAEYKYGSDLTIAQIEANAKIDAAKAGISPYTGDTNARVAIDSRNLQINKQIDDLNKAYGNSLTSISGKDPATLKGANLDIYNRYMADKKAIINAVRSQYDMSITDHLKRLGKSDKEINAILNAVEISPQAKPDASAEAQAKPAAADTKKTKSGTTYQVLN
jgi:hypothetical protein